jgi:acetyltransferase-like isoleucine patch superfamily enzyme
MSGPGVATVEGETSDRRIASPDVHATTVVLGPVELGDGSIVGPFCILGEGHRPDRPATGALRIGRDARVRSHTVLYRGSVIGDRFQTGHGVLVREEVEAGDDVSIGSHSVVEHHVVIADGVRLHSNVFVPEFSRLEVSCWIGPNVVLTNARYPRSHGVKEALAGPTIGAGAKVGANATLLPGVTIGRDALVGAGAVVTRAVAPGDVVVGNPARVIGRIDAIEAYTGLLGVEGGA